jgi:adenosylcobinamide-GDP ribazoletransferase
VRDVELPVKPDCPAWAPPLLAIQFLTRVPVPGLAHLSTAQVKVGLTRAVGWFPLVGALVGAITAATLLLADQFWPRTIAVILALIVEARLTGAFHEDAVADFCDGVGGGRDPEHVRQIMKDSRIGTYGALGLLLAVALRAALMISLDAQYVAVAIIAAAVFGRLLAVLAMVVTPAPQGEGLAKDVGTGVRKRDFALAVVTASPALVACLIIAPAASLIAFAASIAFLIWFRALLLRRVGGSTGDCLGFAAYAGQLILLLNASVW